MREGQRKREPTQNEQEREVEGIGFSKSDIGR